MDMYNRENVPFQAVLEALLDESRPFSPVYLHRFSDIPPANLTDLKQIWSNVPVTRRRSLLEDLEALAEADTVVSFDDLARFALEDPDPQVRVLAIRLLWETEDYHLATNFMHMLDTDPDHLVRAAAANALGVFVYFGEIEEIPAETLQEVEYSLLAVVGSDEHPFVQRKALESLGFSSRPEVPGLLEAAYNRGNVDWLASALFAMGRSADIRWATHVMNMLDHAQPIIREEAARAAGELEIKQAREPLLQMVANDEEDEVQMAAIWALSQIGGEDVRDTLEGILDETDDEELAEFVENALENLSFNEEISQYGALDLETDDEDLDDSDSPGGNGHKSDLGSKR